MATYEVYFNDKPAWHESFPDIRDNDGGHWRKQYKFSSLGPAQKYAADFVRVAFTYITGKMGHSKLKQLRPDDPYVFDGFKIEIKQVEGS